MSADSRRESATERQAAPAGGARRSEPPRPVKWVSSLGLSVLLLCILLLLTWQGTLAQVELGIHAAQRKYFDSFFFWQEWGGLSVPLPGAQLILWILTINLIIGGIIRLRIRKATYGVLVVHLGIILMLLAGMVKYYHSVEGVLSFYPGEVRNQFQSYHEWELAVGERLEDGRWREHIVPGEWFDHATGSDAAVITSGDLPFDLHLDRYLLNCMPRPVQGDERPPLPVVDGFYLQELPLEKRAEVNAAGVRLEVREPGGTVSECLLFGFSEAPLTLLVAGRPYTFDLRKKRTQLEFGLRLEEFIKDEHPGTMLPRDFRSKVTALASSATSAELEGAGGVLDEVVEISMNEPFRLGGYTFYQTSWGPQEGDPERRLYSVIGVMKNPSDQWPLYSCIIIAIGLVLHFGRKLLLYSRSQWEKSS